jgi:hypothetical protein
MCHRYPRLRPHCDKCALRYREDAGLSCRPLKSGGKATCSVCDIRSQICLTSPPNRDISIHFHSNAFTVSIASSMLLHSCSSSRYARSSSYLLETSELSTLNISDATAGIFMVSNAALHTPCQLLYEGGWRSIAHLFPISGH